MDNVPLDVFDNLFAGYGTSADDHPVPSTDLSSRHDQGSIVSAGVDESVLPPSGSPMMVVRSVRLPFEVDERLHAIASGRGLRPSELVRQFVESAIEALDRPGQPMVPLELALHAVQDALRRVPTIAA